MKNRSTKMIVSILLVLLMLFSAIPVYTSAETETNTDGYIEIYTIEDLYNVRLDLTANYILMNDIDLTEATAKGGDWDYGGRGWNPIGSNDIYDDLAFSGIFDGNGHSIIGMRIDVSSFPAGTGVPYIGLFANVAGNVCDLTLKGGNIEAENSASKGSLYVGALAGKATNATIVNVKSELELVSSITQGATSCCGGIVGRSVGSIFEGCSNAAEVYAYSSTGSSTSEGSYAGGIVGYANSTTISESYNSGNITGETTNDSSYSGGIVGEGSGTTIENCYNSGDISSLRSWNNIACGIGYKVSVSQCYNTGSITASSGSGSIYRSAIGGTATNAYYLSGTGASSTGATSLTESQMKTQSMYVGFDFENTWILNKFANHPYPQLRNNIQDLSESAEMVSIIALPIKTEYLTDDELDFAGGMVKVLYLSGREEVLDINESMVSGYDPSVVGEQTVTVSIAGASDTYTVYVSERPEVKSVKMLSQPKTKQFVVGSAFDFTGAVLQVMYEGGKIETKDITLDMTTGGNINHIGKQTITVTFFGKTTTFEVEVIGIVLDKIKITSLPDKLTYLEGQTLELDGLEVSVVMNDGTESVIGADYTVSGYSTRPGTHTVTVSYAGKTASFEVTVEARTLVSLMLNSLPDKAEYIAGQAFDGTGMQLIAKYDNGDVEVAEDYTVTGFDETPGIKNITVSVGDKSVTFPIMMHARVIEEFTLLSLPSKLEYIEYESLDLSGLKAEVKYNNGFTEEITDYVISGFSSKPGVHTISVSYEGFVKTFDITVTERVLEDISVTIPEKISYYIGEVFDAEGLVVKAYYNNGQIITVDSYSISGFESNKPGVKTITVEYGGFEKSFSVVVCERSVIETEGSVAIGNTVARLSEKAIVPVIITKNPGIAGFAHTFNFDNTALKFITAEAVGAYANGTVVINDEEAASGKVTVVWFSGEDIRGDGVAYNLTFEILETAPDGNSGISVSFDENDNANASGENIIFADADGYVEVRSYWAGDLNGDRLCRMTDILTLAQYVAGKTMTLTPKQLLSADVNEDASIDIHDVIKLQQIILDAGVPEETSAQFFSAAFVDDGGNEVAPTQISFGEVTVKSGKEMVIPVSIKNNEGISAFLFDVHYDSNALSFISAGNGNALDKGTLLVKPHAEEGRLTIMWYSANGDIDTDGEIIPLTFKINGRAKGDYELDVSYLPADILNSDNAVITCTVQDGKITVRCGLGDVNADNEIDTVDVVTLYRNVAKWKNSPEVDFENSDLNGDGKIDVIDTIILERFNANWKGYENLPLN